MIEYFPNTNNPIPSVLTAEEAAVYLRLAEGRTMKNALKALNRLVDKRSIRPCLVGRYRRYPRQELDRFLEEGTENYGDVI